MTQHAHAAPHSSAHTAHCTLRINPTASIASINSIVGVTGGNLFIEDTGAYAGHDRGVGRGGHRVSIGEGALTANVRVQLNVFSALSLGMHFLLSGAALEALSDVVELLPAGITFSNPVDVSVVVDTTHTRTNTCTRTRTRASATDTANQTPPDELFSLYYWDDFASSWARVPGSLLVKKRQCY